ncbi:MAG: Rieske (2Fe-2S) protein [Deltaproteobacteria bacterium]|nr:Rieske (2Fe-2S) protein [Deltaproteobacteria bacterium]
MTDQKPEISRRRSLKIIGASALAPTALIGCTPRRIFRTTPGPGPDQEVRIPRHELSALPAGAALWVRAGAVSFVVRKLETVFAAFIPKCTHRGCPLDVEADGFYCPCHGSRFTRAGKVSKGPARMALTQLTVRATDDASGDIFVRLMR